MSEAAKRINFASASRMNSHQSPQNVVLGTLTTFAVVFAVVKGANISVG